jgi:hypothetical protein
VYPLSCPISELLALSHAHAHAHAHDLAHDVELRTYHLANELIPYQNLYVAEVSAAGSMTMGWHFKGNAIQAGCITYPYPYPTSLTLHPNPNPPLPLTR